MERKNVITPNHRCCCASFSHLHDVVQRVQVVGKQPAVGDLGGTDEEAGKQAEQRRQHSSEGLADLGVGKSLQHHAKGKGVRFLDTEKVRVCIRHVEENTAHVS